MKLIVARESTLPLLLFCLAPSARAQVPIYAVEGGPGNEHLGWSLDLVGDVNGDHVDDFVAGAPYAGPGANDGRAALFSGVDGAQLFTWSPPIAGSWFGRAVSAAGDVDGDGVPDVLVGAPLDAPDFGMAFVYSGANGGLLLSLAGTHLHGAYGSAFAPLGDLNADGHADFAVGAPGMGTTSALGHVYVHSGADGALLWSKGGSPTTVDHFGWALAALGDLDGDGRSELVVGAPRATLNVGAAYVLSGLDGTLLFTDDTGPGDDLGYSVAGPGDIDGDLVPDWLVGAPQGGNGLYPRVRLRSGADGSLIHEWIGSSQFGLFGRAVEGAGDVNRDGVPDMWIGQPNDDDSPEKTWFVDGASKLLLFGVTHHLRTNRLALAGGSDLDGDGAPDLLEGRPLNGFSNAPGRVASWRIGCSGTPVESFCATSPNSAGSGALMSYTGSTSVSTNNLRLETFGCPPGQLGLYFYGAQAEMVPFGDGLRCVAAPIYRLNPPVGTGTGAASKLVDLEHVASNTFPIFAGSRWRFQFWYRDPGFGAFGFNLSDGLAVEFCP